MTVTRTPSGGRVPTDKANFERFERPRPRPPAPAEVGSPDGFRWEDPPVDARGRQATGHRLAGHLTELRQNPARWARLATYRGKSSANTAACRLRKAMPGFEFRSARAGVGSALWGRYVGERAS